MSMGLRIAIVGVIVLIALGGIMVYLAQAVQPEVETTVEIIPNDTLK